MSDKSMEPDASGGATDAPPPIDVSGLTALFGASDPAPARGVEGDAPAASDSHSEPEAVLFAHPDDSGFDGDEGETEEYPLAAITEDLDLAEAFRAGDEVDLAEEFLAEEAAAEAAQAEADATFGALVTAGAVAEAPARSLDLAFDAAPVPSPVAHAQTWEGGAPVPATAAETGLPRRKRFTRQQQIIAGIGVAVVALVIAGLALIFVLVGRAPAIDEESLQTLRSEEQALVAGVAALDADITAFEQARTDARSEAEAFTEPLAQMSGISDEEPRAAAQSARVALVAEIDALEIPESVVLESDAAAPTTQEEVDAALAAVRAQSGLVAGAQQDIAAATARLEAAQTAFRDAVESFTASVPTFAAALVADAPDAKEGFRTAVTDAADAIAAGDAFGADGLLPWAAYEVAVAALAVDQQRALDEAAREVEQQRPVTPVRPSTPRPTPSTPPPTEAPVDPEPTDPPVDPEPTTPPTDSGTGESGGE